MKVAIVLAASSSIAITSKSGVCQNVDLLGILGIMGSIDGCVFRGVLA